MPDLNHDGELHVFAQIFEHDDAYIVGNRMGLERLRSAIDQALTAGKGECKIFVNDGEGYAVHVNLVGQKQMDRLAVPYTDEHSREREASNALWPWKL